MKKFFTHNLVFLKLRASVLWALASAVDIIKSSDGVRTKHVEKLKNILNSWEDLWEESRNRKYTPLRQNQVTLPLPSRLHVALDTPHYEIIANTFRILLEASSESGVSDDLVKKIEVTLKDALEMVEKKTSDGKNANLVYRRENMEYVVNIVEV